MAQVRRVAGVRTARRWLAGVALPAVVAVALTSCGTIPPQPYASPSRSPHLFTPSASPVPSSGTPAGPPAPPSPTPSPTSSRTNQTTHQTMQPGTAAPAPPAGSWVGSFRGHPIAVPRGHGATMSFTFDDGPRPGSTAQVLDLLQQHHVQAVFCLIGNQAREYPSLVRREVAAGHELCDHSRDHDIMMSRKRQAYVDAEVGDGLAEIRGAAPPGTPVTFYRQPGGTWTPKVVHAMDAHGLDPLRWSDDPRDWSRPGSATIVHRVLAQLHPGAVVLMHDGGGDRTQSVEALTFLLDAVVAAGWRPVLAPHVTLSPTAAAKPQ